MDLEIVDDKKIFFSFKLDALLDNLSNEGMKLKQTCHRIDD